MGAVIFHKMLHAYQCPPFIMLAMGVIAALALSIALISQYFFGLYPCNLCVIQRYPYGVIILLSMIGFLFLRKNYWGRITVLAGMALTFIVNSLIAFYHSGVERLWWESFLKGCSIPPLKGDMAQILAQIEQRAHAARCDEIPWADPFIGLSMANYNVILCFALAMTAVAAIIHQSKQA